MSEQTDGKITVSKEALRQVLAALVGPGYMIRELQLTREPMALFKDNPINILLAEFNEAATTPTASAQARVAELEALINSPELHDFAKGVTLEAAHQRSRWGSSHDSGKTPADWFWLIGYLAQKALAAQMAGDTDKALHHCISTAAAMNNWHASISGVNTSMRPGIEPPKEGE